MGDAVSMVALVVLVVEITGSASAVGGALVARLLPTIASPLAGVIADRVDRRVVLGFFILALLWLFVVYLPGRTMERWEDQRPGRDDKMTASPSGPGSSDGHSEPG